MDYGKFRFDPLNRAIDYRHVMRLVGAIREANLLHLFPIVVTRANVIVDGQHRIKAAEILKTPIYYIVSDVMKVKHAQTVSANTKGWTKQDFLEHWMNLGLPDYTILYNFWHPRRSWLAVSMAARLCSSGEMGGMSARDWFDNGHFKANRMAFAERVSSMILDFKSFIDFYGDSRFVILMTWLAEDPNYDHERMIQKMQYLSSKLIKQAKTEGYYPIINEIIDYKVKEENRVNLFKPFRKRKARTKSDDKE